MEPRVRLGHISTYCEVLVTYIIWDYILPPQNLSSCLYLYLRFPSFLKCRPFLLWKINTCSYFTLSRTWFCPLSLSPLYSRINAFVLQTCLTISPNTQKHTLALHISLQLPLHFSVCHFNNIFQKNQLHELWSHSYLPCTGILLQSGFPSPPVLLKPWPSQHDACAGTSSGPFSVLILGEPSCVDLIDQSFLLETPSASLLCPHRLMFFLSLRALLASVIFACSSSSPTLVQQLLTAWPLPFLSLNAHSNDITHCLNFKYYSYAFPSLYL